MSATGVLFALAFLIGCVLAFIRHPIYGTMTYVSTLFLTPQEHWWGQGLLLDIRWAVISAAVAVVAMMTSRARMSPTAPILSNTPVILMILIIAWMAVQSFWAMDAVEHASLLSYYLKFFVAMILVYKTVDRELHLRLFMWAYVGGCFYFGWLAFSSYDGGRFEGFGGAGLGEANAGALALVTGIFAGSSLFLAGTWRERAVLFLILPFLMNGVVTTVSRSGFLALAAGGIVFNYFTPTRFRKPVRLLSILAVVLFLVVAGPFYWSRMQSMQYGGEQVEGVDTGGGRIEIIEAQWRMFKDHPWGCGSMCTAVLSPNYIDERFLASFGGTKVRSSHNTVMTFLVEQGVPGVCFYLVMLWWTAGRLRALLRRYQTATGFLPTALPALAAISGAILVGDEFVSYIKFEPRIWFVATIMALTSMSLRVPLNDEATQTPPKTPERGAPLADTR